MSGSTKLQVGVLRLLAGGGSNKRKNQDLIEEYFQEILGFSNSGKEGNLSGSTKLQVGVLRLHAGGGSNKRKIKT